MKGRYEELVWAPTDHYRVIIDLAKFLGRPISYSRAEYIYQSAYLAKTATLNKGITHRYLSEYSEDELYFVELVLGKYIEYFDYPY